MTPNLASNKLRRHSRVDNRMTSATFRLRNDISPSYDRDIQFWMCDSYKTSYDDV